MYLSISLLKRAAHGFRPAIGGLFVTAAWALSPAGHAAAPVEQLADRPVSVLSRTITTIPGGTVSYLRIRPPLLPARPPAPVPEPAAPISPERLAAMERAEAKPYVSLALTATVYTRADGSAALTELRWHDADRSYRAWSGADWRLLSQLSHIETETHRFFYFPFIDAIPLSELPPGQPPAGLALLPAASAPDALPEYYLEGAPADAAATEPVLSLLDWLHAHVHLHRAELQAQLDDIARPHSPGPRLRRPPARVVRLRSACAFPDRHRPQRRPLAPPGIRPRSRLFDQLVGSRRPHLFHPAQHRPCITLAIHADHRDRPGRARRLRIFR